jgi:hypothetical protein
MQSRARYLIVDGHSIIFGWPELRKLHARRSSLAREALLKQLRDIRIGPVCMSLSFSMAKAKRST